MGEVFVTALDIYDVPGHHFSMVFEPHVQALAAQLGRCLLAADAAGDAVDPEGAEGAPPRRTRPP